jgi:hypothetical protein
MAKYPIFFMFSQKLYFEIDKILIGQYFGRFLWFTLGDFFSPQHLVALVESG